MRDLEERVAELEVEFLHVETPNDEQLYRKLTDKKRTPLQLELYAAMKNRNLTQDESNTLQKLDNRLGDAFAAAASRQRKVISRTSNELETAKKEPEAAPVAVAEAHATRVHELKTTIAAAAKEHKICVQQLQYVFDKLEEASTVDALELKKVFDAAEKDHAARVQARETERGAAAKDADKRIADPTASAEVHNARVQELEAERDAAAKEHKTCVEKMQELFDTLRVASSSDAGELKLQFDRLEKDHATLLDLEKRVSDLVAEITSVKFQKGSSEHKELFNKYIELIHKIQHDIE
eukprot:910680_1